MPTEWQVGDKIQGRWLVHKVLRGGMGVVYVVYDEELREPFATKTFQDEIFARSPSVFERFRREALTWINLEAHPNVAQASFVENIQGKPFIFHEYVSGGSLRNWIGTPRLMEDIPQVMRLAIQFCDGMTHALSKGVVAHRDIKPDNCLVTQDQTLKVTDFGLAKVVMLFEMLTGRLPFVASTVEEFYWLHKTGVLPRLSGLAAELRPVLEAGLAKDGNQRFSSFSQVRHAIAQVYERVSGECAPTAAEGPRLNALQLNHKALSMRALGRLREAGELLDQSIGMDPSLEVALINKAIVLHEIGRIEDAINCLDVAIKLNPRSAGAWSNKGSILAELGRADDALASLEHALKLNPRLGEAWNNKGVELARAGKYEEALTCYENALRLNPEQEHAWFNKGKALAAMGRREEAIICYERNLELNPRLERAWVAKGNALGAMGRYEEAIVSYDRALELNPGLALAVSNKAKALYFLKRFDDALACFDHALRLQPQDHAVAGRRAMVLVELGRYREALAAFEEAGRLGDPKAALAIDFLKNKIGSKA